MALDCLHMPRQLWLHDQRDQHVSKALAESGVWEIYETQLIIERLFSGATFVDVGANIGYYTILAADQVGVEGQVFAFEPDTDNFALLDKNINHNALTNIQAVNAGLAQHDSEARLFLSESNFGDHQIYDDGSGRDSQPIQLLNGSQYLQPRLDTIDVLKIDTQGAEVQVLGGLLPLLKKILARNTAAKQSPLSIIIEFWPYGLRKSNASAHELLDLLMALALPLQIIDHIEHTLIACTEQQLREWIDMVDAHPDDQGFMNLLIGR